MGINLEYSCEEEMYPDIEQSIKNKMNFNGCDFKIYKTYKGFSGEIKTYFSKECAIIPNDAKPDFIVIYRLGQKNKIIIIEAKLNQITIKDIGQAKIYGDIFSADHVLLVSTKEPRGRIKEYYSHNPKLLKYFDGQKTIQLVELNNRELSFETAYPREIDPI